MTYSSNIRTYDSHKMTSFNLMYLDLQSHLAYGPGGPVAILAPANFLASVLCDTSVKVDTIGGGESHYALASLAPVYLCGNISWRAAL